MLCTTHTHTHTRGGGRESAQSHHGGKTPALNAKEVGKVTSFKVHTCNYFTVVLMNKEDESLTLTIQTKNRFLASLVSALLPN